MLARCLPHWFSVVLYASYRNVCCTAYSPSLARMTQKAFPIFTLLRIAHLCNVTSLSDLRDAVLNLHAWQHHDNVVVFSQNIIDTTFDTGEAQAPTIGSSVGEAVIELGQAMAEY